MTYEIIFDANFEEYSWETEAKGCLDISVKFDARVIPISFYDQTRLTQEVADSLAAGNIFAERNIIVVSRINRTNIEKAIESLSSSNTLQAWK